MAENITINLDVKSQGIDISSKAMQNLATSGKNAEKSAKGIGSALDGVGKSATGASSATAQMEKYFRNLDKTVGSINGTFNTFRNILAGLGVLWLGKQVVDLGGSFLKAATDMEKYQTQLEIIMGSQRKAGELMQWLSDFAEKNPLYDDDQLAAAASALQRVNLDAKKYMETIGNVAAGTGKSLTEVADAFASAALGKYRALKDYGVSTLAVVKQAGVDSAAELTKSTAGMAKGLRAVVDILDTKFAGGMDKASEKWQGMVTIFSNYWKQFQQEVMQSGVFDALKQGLSFVLEEVKRLKDDGDLSDWAKTMGKSITDAMTTIVSGVGYAIQAFEGFLAALDGMVIAGDKAENAILSGYQALLQAQKWGAEALGWDAAAKATQQAIANLSQAIADNQDEILKYSESMQAHQDAIQSVGDMTDRLVAKMKPVPPAMDNASMSLGEIRVEAERLSDSTEKLGGNITKNNKATGNATKQYEEQAKVVEDVVDLTEIQIGLMEEQEAQTQENIDAVVEYNATYEDLRSALQERIDTSNMTDAEKKYREFEKQIESLTETDQAFMKTLYAQAVAAEETAETSRAAFEKYKDAVNSVANSLEGTLEDVFYGMLTGAKDTFENILDSLKRFISQMLAEIATRKILVPIYAGLFGLGSSDLSSLTGSSSGGILDLVSSLFGGSGGGSSLLGTGSSILSGISSLFGGGSSLSGVSLTAALSGGVASSASTGIFSSISSLFSTVAPLVGVAALAIPLISSLFEDRPQPEFNTTGTVPGTFSEFLSANPEDLLTVDWMNADAEESSGTDAAAIQEMYSTVIKGFQDTFSGIYDALPDAVQTAWDNVSGEAWTNVMESTRATTSLAITGHLKLWVSGFNTYMVQALIGATAEAFSTSMFGDSSGTQKLTDAWLTKITSWFDEKLIASTEDTLDELLTTYGEVLTNFFGGIADIMTYSSIDLNTAWEEAYGYTATPYKDAFESAVEDVDENIQDLTDSLDSLSGEDYATAIANIGTALEERYTLEMEYINAIKTLLQEVKDSIEDTSQSMYLDTLDSTQTYEYWKGQADYWYNQATNATSAEEFATAYSNYINAAQQEWSMLPDYTSSQNPTTTAEITYGDRSSPFDLGYTTTYTTTYPTVDEAYSTGVYSEAYPGSSAELTTLGALADFWDVDTVTDVQTGHDSIADSTAAAVTGLDSLTDTTSETVTKLDALNTSVSDLSATIVTANGNIATSSAALIAAINSMLGTDYEVNA